MSQQQPSPASPAKLPNVQETPTSQGRPLRRRSRMPVWIQELPTYNFPASADSNFQLIDPAKLDEALKNVEPEIAKKIRDDIKFMDYELLRLFRQRDHEAKKQQNRYRLYQIGFMVLATVATMIGSFQAIALTKSPNALPFWAFCETVVALVSTYLATISGREPPMPLWLTNRRRAEHLRREYFRYLMNLPPYDEKQGYERQTEFSKRAANINRGVYPEETATT